MTYSEPTIIKCPDNTLAAHRGLIAPDGRELVTLAQYTGHIDYYVIKYGVSENRAEIQINRRYLPSLEAQEYEDFIYARAAMGNVRAML